MLLTLKHEARRAGFVMPGPERAWKVRPDCNITIGTYSWAINGFVSVGSLHAFHALTQFTKVVDTLRPPCCWG